MREDVTVQLAFWIAAPDCRPIRSSLAHFHSLPLCVIATLNQTSASSVTGCCDDSINNWGAVYGHSNQVTWQGRW